ncbi:MAG: GAF domain-containing protein [Desulfobulbaceae bacterium]|jgi:signal transduction histidine kinase/PAS domain-containing protein|nr:GAF domain-containing protein [Desulfobulbaceae bacterium]
MAKTEKSCGELAAEIKDLRQENAGLHKELQHCRQAGPASDELRRHHRALLVGRECARTIVHAQEVPSLLAEVCRIIVEIGKYRLAWFGRAENDGAKTVRPLAQHGYEKGYLSTLRITWDDAVPSGQGPTGIALRTARPSISRNILTDPAFEPWRAQALKRGFQSSLALPVCPGGRIYGTLNVYAAEPDAFDNDEVTLLAGLAEDVASAISTLQKLGDYRHFQEELLESEERYKAVVDSLGIGVTLLSPDMEVLALNKCMRQWFPDVKLDKRFKCHEVFNSPPSPTVCSYCPVCKTLEDGHTHESFTDTPAGDEIRNYRIVASPIKDRHGKVVAAIEMVEDVTEAKRNEALQEKLMAELEVKNRELEDANMELKASQSHLLQQEKMASIGQLAAGVAHEINNPLGFVASNLKSLAKYVDRLVAVIAEQSEMLAALLPAEEQEQLKKKHKKLKLNYITQDAADLTRESLEGTNRINKIVQGLKTFSRVDGADFKAADLNECLESTINIVWNELKYKAEIKKEYGLLPLTRCFPNQLNQVFMNLLVNAAHAIPDFGEIIVKSWQEGDEIFVAISDNGSGIREDIVNRIFEPFYTTKEVGKGTGLGLSIAYDIVTKKHNGEITVQSEVGKGTTFMVKIPVVLEGE